MMFILFTKNGAPIGRAEVSIGQSLIPPDSVIWRERVFVHRETILAGEKYFESDPFEIPDMSVREAPKAAKA